MMRVGMIAAVLLAGCEGVGEPAAVPPGGLVLQSDVAPFSAGPGSDHFILRLPSGKSVSVVVGAKSITGPNFTLTRYADASDHAIRGNVFNQPVDVDVTADGAHGLVGNGVFDIKVARMNDVLQIHGTVSGKPSNFALDGRSLNGNVGQCMFQMARQGAEYSGTRGCRASADAASLGIPASFGLWSLPELGTALSILLSSGS
jgi:hypothetical protein